MAPIRSAGSFWKTVMTNVPRDPLPTTPNTTWSAGAARATVMPAPAIRNILRFIGFPLQRFEPRLRVAETIQLHVHPVHNRKEQTAQLAIVVAGLQIVQRAPRLDRASQ